MMLLNSDFSQRAIVTPDDYQWIPSPQPGVERVMLDRIGREQARATSLVRYAPGSKFPAHSHPGGEEILVLDGIFTENGVDYPAGWYLRSPDGSSHQPSSRGGTTIFVKLRQMSADERQPVRRQLTGTVSRKDKSALYSPVLQKPFSFRSLLRASGSSVHRLLAEQSSFFYRGRSVRRKVAMSQEAGCGFRRVICQL